MSYLLPGFIRVGAIGPGQSGKSGSTGRTPRHYTSRPVTPGVNVNTPLDGVFYNVALEPQGPVEDDGCGPDLVMGWNPLGDIADPYGRGFDPHTTVEVGRGGAGGGGGGGGRGGGGAGRAGLAGGGGSGRGSGRGGSGRGYHGGSHRGRWGRWGRGGGWWGPTVVYADPAPVCDAITPEGVCLRYDPMTGNYVPIGPLPVRRTILF